MGTVAVAVEVGEERVGLTREGQELVELMEERDWELAVAQRWRGRAAEWAAIEADCELVRWLGSRAEEGSTARWRAVGACYGGAHAAADRAAAAQIEINRLVGLR
ncbi:MAG: hypothetical protein Q8Q14_06375 [Gemmatimonadales bacterium]|nr:hypothetical protein [Gemmatimonadales bacterium]